MNRPLAPLALVLALACANPALAAEDISRINGSIETTAGGHYGDLETVNGAVRVAERVQAGAASTVNGSITVGDGARLESLEAVNGSLRLGRDVQVAGGIETVNGSVFVDHGSTIGRDVETVNGAIRAGRGLVLTSGLETVNGSIFVDRGGRIGGDIETVNGSIVVNDADLPSREVEGYFLKELYYVDSSTSSFRVTPLAICPVLHRMDDLEAATTRYPLFWIPYPALEPYTRRMPMLASSLNNSLNGTIDDFFRQRRYDGEIYKVGNPRNLSISQYTTTPEEMKAEQERIEKELVDFKRTLEQGVSNMTNPRPETQQSSGSRSNKRTQQTQGASQTMRDRRY